MQIKQFTNRTDNYFYAIIGNDFTAIIDPAEPEQVIPLLRANNIIPTHVISTHHHADHTGANLDLKRLYGVKILGGKDDADKIPGIDQELQDQDKILNDSAIIMTTPGHTLGHICVYFPKASALFTGDCIFNLGAGRLFEGTPEQAFNSFQKIKALPPETLIYCGHEYAAANSKFALAIAPDNPHLLPRFEDIQRKTEQNQPTVPFSLKDELLTNPFVQAKNPEEFAHIRQLRNEFKA